MKRVFFLLLFYFCLITVVGKHVRVIFGKSLTEKGIIAKTFLFDFKSGEAEENEESESDTEDTEERGFDSDDKELTALLIQTESSGTSIEFRQAIQVFKDHLQEIGTPPPRF